MRLSMAATIVASAILNGQQPTSTLQLQIAQVGSPPRVGEAVRLEVRVVNTSRETRPGIVPLDWPNRYFVIEVRAPDGSVLSPNLTTLDEGPPSKTSPTAQARIPAGAFVGRLLTISRERTSERGFHFAVAGTYRVAALLTVFDSNLRHGATLASDTVAVRVEP